MITSETTGKEICNVRFVANQINARQTHKQGKRVEPKGLLKAVIPYLMSSNINYNNLEKELKGVKKVAEPRYFSCDQ